MPAAGEISRRTAPRNDSTRQNRELLKLLIAGVRSLLTGDDGL